MGDEHDFRSTHLKRRKMNVFDQLLWTQTGPQEAKLKGTGHDLSPTTTNQTMHKIISTFIVSSSYPPFLFNPRTRLANKWSFLEVKNAYFETGMGTKIMRGKGNLAT